MSHDAAPRASDHAAVGHVVPLWLLFSVLGALLVLTVITVSATWLDLGRLNIVIALGIAVIKAALVLLFFMHLRWDRPFHAIVLITAFALVALFIALTLIDSFHYLPDTIPGYSPGVKR